MLCFVHIVDLENMAGMKFLSITNITIVIFIIYLAYTASTFYAMFRPPTCRSNNCLSPHFSSSSNRKLKVNHQRYAYLTCCSFLI